MIYVVGNEQNYHFDILKKILKILGMEWWDIVLHLSYGMVELPHGRMKSREGTVVDADDLLDEMYQTAKKNSPRNWVKQKILPMMKRGSLQHDRPWRFEILYPEG